METSCVLCEVRTNAEETVVYQLLCISCCVSAVVYQLLIVVVGNVGYGCLTFIDRISKLRGFHPVLCLYYVYIMQLTNVLHVSTM